MDNVPWNFHVWGTATNDMSSIEAGGARDSSGHPDSYATCTMPGVASGKPEGWSTRGQGGFQGQEMQDAMGQAHTNPSVQLSSHHLLLAAKFFQRKRLQKALVGFNANASYAAHSHTDDHVWPPSHRMQEETENVLRRIQEGSSGAARLNESRSVPSNGTEMSSPQQISCDTLLPLLISPMGYPPYFQEALSFSPGMPQTKPQILFSQAVAGLHERKLDTFDGPAAQANQVQDAIWHSYSQDALGVVAEKPKTRVRARRGQATDPHSIAERLRRERIAERLKSLQELVPNTNKTDRAVMLDEIIEYVKFLLLQVKVLSLSRLGGAGLVVPLVAGLPEGKSIRSETLGPSQDSMLGVEEHVAKLITNNVGAAMQFLQMKGLCLMPMSFPETNQSTDANSSSSATIASTLSTQT